MLDTSDSSLRTPASHRGGGVLAGAVLRTPIRGGGTVPARSAVRPEIQALRAIAVLTVVAYHLWPRAIPGGFVGVDVFLAISGFLITSLLMREIERTGTLSLAGFWARRARRILPAALLVLAFCAAATFAVVPSSHWQQFFAEMRASTAYVENWHLAAAAVDYGAPDGVSPVRHFWSLSAEEQFYLVWPVLLLLAAPRRRHIVATVVAATAASLVFSVVSTAADPSAAYFVTPARAWEFGAGGVLALLAPRLRLTVATRCALCWAGLGAIAAAAFTYDHDVRFPGYAALLPIAGSLAVMAAGTPEASWSPARLLTPRPVQFTGDISYAIYLWHWPLLVLAPFVLPGGRTTPTAIGLIMLTFLAAWVTKLLVEDPVRTGRFLVRRRAHWTFGFAGAATALVLALTVTGTARVQAMIRADERTTERTLAAHPACFGAAAHDPEKRCENPALRLTVIPAPAEAAQRPNAPCRSVRTERGVTVCTFGATSRRATAGIALIGDSHAAHWRAALDPVARARGWRGFSMSRSGCPLTRATRKLDSAAEREQCVRWNRDVTAWLSRHPEVRTVVVAQLSGSGVVTGSGQDPFEAEVDGYMGAWRALPRTVQRVFVIRDTPKVPGHGETAACVERAMAARRPAGPACAVSRREAVEPDPAAVAAQRMGSARVRTVDLLRFFCDRTCHPVIGGALVYKDRTHITAVFGATLAPYLGRRIDELSTGARARAARKDCFGAAARDPRSPDCRRRRPPAKVVPDPAHAATLVNWPCTTLAAEGLVSPCAFGVRPDRAARNVALIGDSHVLHWRGAAAAVAERSGWRGVSLAYGHCWLTFAVRDVPEPERSACVRYSHWLPQWLRRHPEISVVFVSGITGGRGVLPSRGRSPFETAVAGYLAAWKALPRTVEHVVVLRDTPKARGGGVTLACVRREVAAGRPAARACRMARAEALDPDPAAEAARRLHSRRALVVDLTRMFCDRRWCYSVIGGVLVHKDATHVTAVFSRTLGPYLGRALRRLLRAGRR